jgi:hypothetical protein
MAKKGEASRLKWEKKQPHGIIVKCHFSTTYYYHISQRLQRAASQTCYSYLLLPHELAAAKAGRRPSSLLPSLIASNGQDGMLLSLRAIN